MLYAWLAGLAASMLLLLLVQLPDADLLTAFAWLHAVLACSLRSLGSQLLVLRGTPQEVFPRIFKVRYTALIGVLCVGTRVMLT
jgi:hypothetical protein